MGRNTPSLRRKLESIKSDAEKIAHLLREKNVELAIYEIMDYWYRESGAITAVNNPLLHFNLLFLTVAKIWAEIKNLEKNIEALIEKVEGSEHRRRDS